MTADPRQAYTLLSNGDRDAALRLTTPLAEAASPTVGALAAHATVLKAHGRFEDALATDRRAVALFGGNAVVWHNLASTLGDFDQPREAEQAARKAIALGLAAPETRLVLARALQAQRRWDEAQAAFAAAIQARPTYQEAHRDLAQLIWMRTADVGAALMRLDAAIAAAPGAVELWLLRATVLEFADDLPAAAASLDRALARVPGEFRLLRTASHIASERGFGREALAYARQAAATAPDTPAADLGLAEACLAAGQPREARACAQRQVDRDPDDQFALALLATAWRLLDDPRYAALYDYDAFVGVHELAAPDGWATREAFLAEVAGELHGLHGLATHPLQQSLRHGSQATLKLNSPNGPAIDALLDALRAPIAAHIARLGQGDDPLRRRNSGAGVLTGAWSVQLRASGFHTNHVHPRGWLSSACYIELPSATQDSESRAGWIKFGQPGVRTEPPLAAERHVRPRPGRLVLFPAYMWHGTVPFESDQSRLTVAFDVVPAAG